MSEEATSGRASLILLFRLLFTGFSSGTTPIPGVLGRFQWEIPGQRPGGMIGGAFSAVSKIKGGKNQ
jgi:hypothetical protein